MINSTPSIKTNTEFQKLLAVRPIALEDAERYLALRRALFSETKFMLLEPEEIEKVSLDDQRTRLSKLLTRPNARLLVAEINKDLIGFLIASGGDVRRTAHCASLAAGVLQRYSGKGVASRLFGELHAWAPTVGITRLELGVMVHNSRALSLYRRLGYETEGTKRSAFRVDGQNIDEYFMAKILIP